LPPEKLKPRDIDAASRSNPTRAMGSRDALRNPLYRLAPPTTDEPLPLSEHARMRHRAMSDLQNLIEIVSLDANRIKAMVRPPFEIESFESANSTSMRMPPFMRKEMSVIALDRRPGSTRAGNAHSSKRGTCTPKRIAGSVGRGICALAAETRKRTREARRAAISFVTGWTFALPAIASFQAHELNTSRVDR
jgi:hypothetical protein